MRFALARRRCYLGLAPGLGKTAVAATVARLFGLPTVYICPPFLVRNVENEFAEWAPKLRVGIYGKLSGSGVHGQGKEKIASEDVDVLIVPDSLIARGGVAESLSYYRLLRGKGREAILFVDEAHRFKNAKAKRTAALLGDIVDRFDRRIYLSGTPIPNRPMELFALLNAEAPETIDFMDEWTFGRKFCAGFQKKIGWDALNNRPRMRWDFSGASNIAELKARVQGTRWPFMLRLHKDLLGLPPKTEQVFIISANMSPQLARLDKAVAAAYGERGVDAIRERLAAAAREGGELEAGADLHIMAYRRLLGIEKAKPSAEYIRALLEDTDQSILVFAYHTEVVAVLEQELAAWRPIVITGKTPKGRRQTLVDEFQTSPERRLVIGNYIAMGVGFTMTKAERVIFVEYDWVPGVNEQAGDRAHRIGQDKNVLIQYVVYKNSIDKDVIEKVLTKSDTTKRL